MSSIEILSGESSNIESGLVMVDERCWACFIIVLILFIGVNSSIMARLRSAPGQSTIIVDSVSMSNGLIVYFDAQSWLSLRLTMHNWLIFPWCMTVRDNTALCFWVEFILPFTWGKIKLTLVVSASITWCIETTSDKTEWVNENFLVGFHVKWYVSINVYWRTKCIHNHG